MAYNGDKPLTTRPIDRTIQVLEITAQAAQPLSVTEIARQCDLPVSTLHRLLKQFEARGLVKKAFGTKCYTVGTRLLDLGSATLRCALSSDAVHQLLANLASHTGEQCHIGVCIDNQIHYVESASPALSHGLRFNSGHYAPLHCTSIGKLFLANMREDHFERWLERAALSQEAPGSITQPQRLHAEIARIRVQKWAYSNEELVPGVVGCAVPILGPRRELAAGLGIAVPSARMALDELKGLSGVLATTAEQISRVLQEIKRDDSHSENQPPT